MAPSIYPFILLLSFGWKSISLKERNEERMNALFCGKPMQELNIFIGTLAITCRSRTSTGVQTSCRCWLQLLLWQKCQEKIQKIARKWRGKKSQILVIRNAVRWVSPISGYFKSHSRICMISPPTCNCIRMQDIRGVLNDVWSLQNQFSTLIGTIRKWSLKPTNTTY